MAMAICTSRKCRSSPGTFCGTLLQVADFFAQLAQGIAEIARRYCNIRSCARDCLYGEIGDLFFVLVNLARFLKVDPEQALRKTNRKFRHRFGYVERELAGQGKTLRDSSVAEMEELWQEAKNKA